MVTDNVDFMELTDWYQQARSQGGGAGGSADLPWAKQAKTSPPKNGWKNVFLQKMQKCPFFLK